jgi:magnesium-transporting ATPase (P-type)
LVVEALDDLTMQILIVCAIVSLIVNAWTEDLSIAWIEPSAILFAVSACTLVAAGNDYQKEKQFIELNAVAEDKKKVSTLPT